MAVVHSAPVAMSGEEKGAKRRCEVALVFGVTYVGYGLLYFVRKPFGIVKSDLKVRFQLQTGTLAAVDMAFLLSYTISNLTVGHVEAFFGTRGCLIVAFLGSALATALFPQTDLPPAWMLCWLVQGVFQAWVYPLCARLLSEQFSAKVRSSMWGIWVTCQHVGGMLGTFAAAELHAHFGWRSAFLVPSVWVLMAGASMRLLPGGGDQPSESAASKADDQKQTPSLRTALGIPFVKTLGLSYFCIKLIRYVGVLWLPFFLSDLGFDSETAAFLSIAFDVGGVLGGTFCGILADACLGGRLLMVILAMCGLCSLLCLLYSELHLVLGRTGHVVVLFALGVSVAGPDANFGGAACISVVEREGGQGAVRSVASGFVNSMGALGTVFTGVLVTGAKSLSGGWMGMWVALAGLAAIPCAALPAAALAEHHAVRLQRQAEAEAASEMHGKGPSPSRLGAGDAEGDDEHAVILPRGPGSGAGEEDEDGAGADPEGGRGAPLAERLGAASPRDDGEP